MVDNNKVQDIQILRGISIILVLLQHLSLTSTTISRLNLNMQLSCYIGVELFFVISGFVITLALQRDAYNARSFFIKRIFRLWPAIICFFVTSFFVIFLMDNAHLNNSMRELFVVSWQEFAQQGFGVIFGCFILITQKASYYNGAMWSLSVEDQFYAFIALTCLLSGYGFRTAKTTGRILLSLVIAVYATCLIFRIGSYFSVDAVNDFPRLIKYFVSYKFDFIPLGVMAAFMSQKISLPNFVISKGTYLSILLLIIPLSIVAIAESPFSPSQLFLTGVALPVTGLCFFLLVWIASVNSAFSSYKEGLFYRIFLYLGDRSYTIYLLHFPVMALSWLLMYELSSWFFSSAVIYGVSQIIFTIPILCLFVEVIYRRIEVPFISMGKSITKTFYRTNMNI